MSIHTQSDEDGGKHDHGRIDSGDPTFFPSHTALSAHYVYSAKEKETKAKAQLIVKNMILEFNQEGIALETPRERRDSRRERGRR
jgi:hypothetical protein